MIDIYIHRLAMGIGRLLYILISFFDFVKSDAGRRGRENKPAYTMLLVNGF